MKLYVKCVYGIYRIGVCYRGRAHVFPALCRFNLQVGYAISALVFHLQSIITLLIFILLTAGC